MGVDKITEATSSPAQPNKKAEQQHTVLRSLFGPFVTVCHKSTRDVIEVLKALQEFKNALKSFKSIEFISIPDDTDDNSD